MISTTASESSTPAATLPLQLPVRAAMLVYLRTLGIFALIVLGNLVFFSLFLLVSPAELVPIAAVPIVEVESTWSSSFPNYKRAIFQDSFEGTLDPKWVVLEGQPVIEDGRLSAAAALLVLQWIDAVPDEYAVTMEVSEPDTPGHFVAWAAGPALRYSIAFEVSSAKAFWQTSDGVTWQNASEPAQYHSAELVDLLAANGAYAALSDGALSSIYTNPLLQDGPFTLFISQGMYLDSVTISVP